jgi:hypothetical protein
MAARIVYCCSTDFNHEWAEHIRLFDSQKELEETLGCTTAKEHPCELLRIEMKATNDGEKDD